jgi:hypothetical protein
MEEEEVPQMELSVRSVTPGAWGGYRIPRGGAGGQRQEEDERGRLSLAESAEAVAARIAGIWKIYIYFFTESVSVPVLVTEFVCMLS